MLACQAAVPRPHGGGPAHALFANGRRPGARGAYRRVDLEWWAIDAGLLMYRPGRPPREVEVGSWVSGEIYVGVDPFMYMQRFSRHHTAPGLIYDWKIHKIEQDIAPLIGIPGGGRMRDRMRPGWREIEKTNAWKDGAADGAPPEYVLHCERLDNPPRR